MDWFDENDVQAKLKEVPKFKMNNSSFEQIRSNLKNTVRESEKSKKPVTAIKSTIVALSGIAVAIAVFIHVPLHRSSLNIHGTTGGLVSSRPAYPSNSVETTKKSQNDTPFDYTKFLSFTPLLPSITSGLKMYQQSSINIRGNVGNFSVEYGGTGSKWFNLSEQLTSELQPSLQSDHVQNPKRVTKNGINLIVSPVLSNQSNTLKYFYVALVKNHIDFNLTFSSTFSTSEAEDIATHLNVINTQKPSILISTNNVSEAMKAISFKPVIPSRTLTGYHQGIVSSNVNFASNTQQFGIQYDSNAKGIGNLTVIQSTGKNTWARQIFAKANKSTVGGQSAYLANTQFTGPCLMWIDPKTGVLFEILMSAETQQSVNRAKQLASIFINAAN